MYWLDITTVAGTEARLEHISEEELDVVMPLLSELGACATFGLSGTTEVLGGCLATIFPRDQVLDANETPANAT